MQDITIRQETVCDYAEVFALVKESFQTVPGSDGDEAEYMNGIRDKAEFIPDLSLVAVNPEQKIVGQIVLYKTTIRTKSGPLTELLLSPLCVHPDHWRKGIARALIERAIELAAKLQYKAVFLCGDPAIYSKLGFVPTYRYDIIHEQDKERNAEWSMVREIKSGFLMKVKGTIDTK